MIGAPTNSDLPTQQRKHDDAEFEDEIGGGHFERHRRGEVRAFAEDRAGQSHCRVGARRRRCPEGESGPYRAGPVVWQELADLPMRDDSLYDRG